MPENNLISKCFFRADGVMCNDGMLTYSSSLKNVSVEGEPVTCPACEGKGMLLTSSGKELLLFLEVFARPLLRDLVDEALEH